VCVPERWPRPGRISSPYLPIGVLDSKCVIGQSGRVAGSRTSLWRRLLSAPIVAVTSFVVGLLGTSLAHLNFDRFGPDDVVLDRHIESEWWKLIGVYAIAIALAGVITFFRAEIDGLAGLLGVLAGVSIVAGHALATSRVSGGNFWMLGLPLVVIPALAAGLATVALTTRLRRARSAPELPLCSVDVGFRFRHADDRAILAACTGSFLLAATSTRSVTSAGSTAARSTCPPPSREFALSPTDGRR
jgi:hypothetical protein